MDSTGQSTGKFTIFSENVDLIKAVLENNEFEYHDIPIEYNFNKTFPTVVVENFCSDCILCETMCPVLKLDPVRKKMTLNQTSCKGCGNCIPACPTAALQQRYASYGVVIQQVHKKLQNENVSSNPVSCNYCTLVATEVGEIDNGSGLDSVRLICSGRIEPYFVLEALLAGIKNVIVVGCYYRDYNFSVNTPHVEQRLIRIHELMELLGLNTDRLKSNLISIYDEKFKNYIFEVSKTQNNSND